MNAMLVLCSRRGCGWNPQYLSCAFGRTESDWKRWPRIPNKRQITYTRPFLVPTRLAFAFNICSMVRMPKKHQHEVSSLPSPSPAFAVHTYTHIDSTLIYSASPTSVRVSRTCTAQCPYYACMLSVCVWIRVQCEHLIASYIEIYSKIAIMNTLFRTSLFRWFFFSCVFRIAKRSTQAVDQSEYSLHTDEHIAHTFHSNRIKSKLNGIRGLHFTVRSH